MNLAQTRLDGRLGWRLSNDRISLVFLAGGGHFASLTHADNPELNPLWTPPWKGMDPWRYRPSLHQATYGSRLLASIRGHNLCLPAFGPPSPSEAAAGFTTHGETSVQRWRSLAHSVSSRRVTLRLGCLLPLSAMACQREITLLRGKEEAHITDHVTNLLARDIPFAMAQHLTIGPPFLVSGTTVLECSATRGVTYPAPFEDRPRLLQNAEYSWPLAPGAHGKPVDLRILGPTPPRSSDFSTQLLDPSLPEAWLRIRTPGLPLVLSYRWSRADYPFLGLWDEHHGRDSSPWNARTLCRGVELLNTPFGLGLRDAIERGRVMGQPAFAWLPAKTTRSFSFTVRWAADPLP